MKNYIYLPLLLSLMIFLTGCNAGENAKSLTANDSASKSSSTEVSASTAVIDSSDIFSDRDYEVGYDENNSTCIVLKGSSAQCDSDAVQISKNKITIKEEGTYILSGTLDDGMIIVDAEKTDKLQIILDNASIHSKTSAAIYILQADKVFLTLAADSKNELSNGTGFTKIDDNNIDAVIFSKDDLTLNGSGAVTINSPAGHGIVSKDELIVTGGTYQITANNHGISGKDNICIADGTFDITSGKDGLHAENADDTSLGFIYIDNGSFSITSTDDAMHSSSNLTINNGTYKISAGDDGFHADSHLTIADGTITVSKSYEGIEGSSISISGGTISLTSTDDGLNAAGGADQSGMKSSSPKDNFSSSSNSSISISGGNLSIDASGDGIDSNGSLSISGGEIFISGSTEGGNGALDYDGEAKVSGGTIIAIGSSGMAQNFDSSSTQGSILVSVETQPAGSSIELTDSNGKSLISQKSNKEFSSVLISCPEIKKGSSYVLTAGTSSTNITMDSLIYGSGKGMERSGMGGMKENMNKNPEERMNGRGGKNRLNRSQNEVPQDGTSSASENPNNAASTANTASNKATSDTAPQDTTNQNTMKQDVTNQDTTF
ncbi:MAG: carbohydrate-binding domain-containing protein [Lachnospiraceae bacterium]